MHQTAAKVVCEAVGSEPADMVFIQRSSDVFGIMHVQNVEQAVGFKEAFMASGVWSKIDLLHEIDLGFVISIADQVRGIYLPAGQES